MVREEVTEESTLGRIYPSDKASGSHSVPIWSFAPNDETFTSSQFAHLLGPIPCAGKLSCLEHAKKGHTSFAS